MKTADWTKLTPIGKQSGLTVSTSVTSLTLPSGAKPRAAIVTCYTKPIRYWVNGDEPTATTGHRMDDKDVIYLFGVEIGNFKAIRESDADATLEITYYG